MIDFHCHVDLYPDPKKVIAEAEAAGVYVLSVTTTPKAWLTTANLAKGKKRIRTALGMHPQLAHERHNELALFEELLPRTRYVGEIGLDGGPDYSAHIKLQRKVFESVLALTAHRGGGILSIHSRHAADEVLDHLVRFPAAGTPILHWFSGTPAQLRRAVDMGCWFSVGRGMLRSAKGRALTSAMPPSRILTETDGPFGRDRNRPLRPTDAWLAVQDLASIWRLSAKEAGDRLLDNLQNLSASAPDPTRSATNGKK